jgi:hypothetical protein
VKSTHTNPFVDGSENKLLKLISLAESGLRVYVYDIPTNIRRCGKPFRPGLKQMFDMEYQIPRYYRNSTMLTKNPQDANIFIVDHEWICLRVGSEPRRYSPERPLFSGNNIARDHVLPIWKNVIHNFPYYNKSGGHDHFTTFVFDNGPFCGGGHIQPFSIFGSQVMKLLENVSIIGNNGYKGPNDWKKHCEKPCEGKHSYSYCHREGLDIVIPQAHDFFKERTNNQYAIRNRTSDSFFKGSTHIGLDCSPSIRPFLSTLHLQLNLSQRNINLWQKGHISKAIFAFCPAGVFANSPAASAAPAIAFFIAPYFV